MRLAHGSGVLPMKSSRRPLVSEDGAPPSPNWPAGRRGGTLVHGLPPRHTPHWAGTQKQRAELARERLPRRARHHRSLVLGRPAHLEHLFVPRPSAARRDERRRRGETKTRRGARRGETRRGEARRGETRRRRGGTRREKTRRGEARRGETRRGKTREGEAKRRREKTREDETRRATSERD